MHNTRYGVASAFGFAVERASTFAATHATVFDADVPAAIPSRTVNVRFHFESVMATFAPPRIVSVGSVPNSTTSLRFETLAPSALGSANELLNSVTTGSAVASTELGILSSTVPPATALA